MDQLPPPPPYTPHDPTNSPSSETSEQPPVRASMRGGFLNIIADHEETPVSSAAAYFEQRPLTVPIPLPLMSITLTITPWTTRDDLSYTQRVTELRSHDVSTQDWATFVNYIVAELRNDVQNDLEKNNVPMSLEEFRDSLPRIEALATEWNRSFFEPRKVLFDAQYIYELAARSPSPSPSYRTFQTLPPPFPVPSHLPSFPPMIPLHTGPHLGSHMSPHMGPHVRPPPHSMVAPHQARSHVLSPMQIVPPQISRPSLPVIGGRVIGTHSHGHHRCEHRGRGSHVRGSGHHHRSSSISSLNSISSSFSSSSSSSGSNVDSISSEDIQGVDEKAVRQSLETFRLNPTRLDDVKSAILQLHSELHSCQSGNHRGLSRACRGSTERTWEMKATLKANKKLIKSEIKAFLKEARTHKRAVKHQRKADKRIARAEKKYRKFERRAQGSGLGQVPETILGHSEVNRDLRPDGSGLRGVRSYAVNCTPTNTMGRATSGIDRIPSWSPGYISGPQESSVMNGVSTSPRDHTTSSPGAMSMRSDTGSATKRLSEEELARIAEEGALEVERRLRGMEIYAKNMERLREAAARQREKKAERREREAEREAKQREKEAERLCHQREKEAQRWEKEARRISRGIEKSSEQKNYEASERVEELRKHEEGRKRRQQQENEERYR